jgi:hypothetical protein
VSSKRWHLPTNLHGAKTRNITTLTTVMSSNLARVTVNIHVDAVCTGLVISEARQRHEGVHTQQLESETRNHDSN